VDTPLIPETGPYALTKSQFRDAMTLFYSGKIRLVNAVLHTMYGPADSPTKFTTHVIREFLGRSPALNMTPGGQVRDFIYIDDVVSAFITIAEAAAALPDRAQFEVGSGEGITLSRYVDMAKLATGAQTELRTILKYRESDLIPMVADITALRGLGWSPKFSVEDGIRQTVAGERKIVPGVENSPIMRS
jgi:nucleoside-diphosphate-sugar epimerase